MSQRVFVPTNPLYHAFSNPRTRQGTRKAPGVPRYRPEQGVHGNYLNIVDSYSTMPSGKSYKYKPKKGKRKYRRRPRIPRDLVPYSKMVKVKATNFIAHTAHTTGALVMTPLQLNSFDDPFTSGGIGQPLGYDQYKALYKKAFVVSSKVTVRIVNTDATYAVVVGLTPCSLSQAGTALAVYEHYMELPGTKSVILSPDMDHGIISSKVKVKKHLHLGNMRDVDEIKMDLVNETAPADLAYWHLWSQPINQASDPTGDVQLVITCEYIAVLIDPVIPARSEET